MAYTITERAGRFHVTSPKGKTWKTSYNSQAAADKAVAYIEGRFGGGGSSPVPPTPSSSLEGLDDDKDTAHDRKVLGIPPLKNAEEEDTEGW